MALLTVTNSSATAPVLPSVILNRPQTGGFGISPDAVGGNISDPLPFPFNLNGTLAVGANRTLTVNPRDLTIRQPLQTPAVPAEEWDNLINKGYVSISYADDPRSVDVENQLIAVIV